MNKLYYASTPFKINSTKFRYLGIWVTRDFKDLYKANFPPLLSSIKQDFERWDFLPLSLGGRINVIKLNILPKLLYLFQCVPIFLTKSFFSNLNNHISSFIWNKKHPRIKKNILQKPRSQGGMALPNFMYYYWAANIRALLYWMRNNTSSPSWKTLEAASVTSSSLDALLCSKLPLSQPISALTSNPIVVHSLKIWNQFRRSFKLTDLSFAAPLSNNHMFVPSLMDKAFITLSNKGMSRISDLYIDNLFASFEQLTQKFNLSNSNFYQYLQVRNFVSSNSDCFPCSPPASLLDFIFK